MRITEVEEIVMENIDKNIVLKVVNLNCCEECPKKLEKALSKLTGVSSLAIDTEENLVSVSGTVDSYTLRKLIYVEIGKKAKVVSCDTKSTNNVEEKKPNNTKTMGDRDSKNNSNCHVEGKVHKSCSCCQDGNCHNTMENNEHKCEAYEGPPMVKDFVCRDYFCKIHPRNRVITDRVPANESSASMFGYFPNYAQWHYGGPNPWYPIRSSYYPRWYPEQPPARYGYYQQPRRPQPPYGFY